MKFDDTIAMAAVCDQVSGTGDDVTTESSTSEGSPQFVIVERRRLWRDCLVRWFGLAQRGAHFAAYDTADECIENLDATQDTAAIFLCVEPIEPSADDIRKLVDKFDPIPVVVLSDSEDFAQFAAARHCGAKGCMSANVSLDMLFEAMKTAAAGGFVMTPDGIDAMQRSGSEPPRPTSEHCATLTSRQAAVAEALRQGKPNKIIAHELGMCENTVKVHVRSILTKLNATNRTEAAFKLNGTDAARAAAQPGSASTQG
jgi:DNA-binding NarL/FixJ family response regulator